MLLRYENELKRILVNVKNESVFVSKDVSVHGNILRKMWQEGVVNRVGKQVGDKGSYTYKLPAPIRLQAEALINGKSDTISGEDGQTEDAIGSSD